MKRTREHRVPLSAEAMKLIERLPRNGEYLFTVNGNGKPIVAHDPAQGAAPARRRRLHGARLPLGVPRLGRRAHHAPRELLEVALAHAIGNETEAGLCARRPAGEAPPLMQQWATFLAAPAARTTGKVVSLRGDRRG